MEREDKIFLISVSSAVFFSLLLYFLTKNYALSILLSTLIAVILGIFLLRVKK
jgi:hypothetical protein